MKPTNVMTRTERFDGSSQVLKHTYMTVRADEVEHGDILVNDKRGTHYVDVAYTSVDGSTTIEVTPEGYGHDYTLEFTFADEPVRVMR